MRRNVGIEEVWSLCNEFVYMGSVVPDRSRVTR